MEVDCRCSNRTLIFLSTNWTKMQNIDLNMNNEITFCDLKQKHFLRRKKIKEKTFSK